MKDHKDNRNRVIIFDTTLRDGEQSPGFGMRHDQKLRMARMLAELGVDIIEAGFAAASDDDFAAIKAIATNISGPTLCSLARCHEGDIRRAAEALAPAENTRLHVFIATSPIHREHKLRMSRDEVLHHAVEGVRLARQFTDDVEFSAEDAMRTEADYLAEVLSAVIEAGASTVNIPDTVGYITPTEIAERVAYLKRTVRDIDQAVISAHCHDDLGLAVANSLAAVGAGARQVECTINGIGERAGNCALEEVVMALRTRAEHYGLHTGVNTRRLYPASRLLAAITGSMLPRNKSVVGDNAFAHEAGIHQHGMLANRDTYEIMRPEDVGISRTTLVLGKHSGRHALSDRVRTLGHDPDQLDMTALFRRFKQLADQKRQVMDADIEALIADEKGGRGEPWHLLRLHTNTSVGEDRLPSAAVALRGPQEQLVQEAATGDGPVDASFKAIERATGIPLQITGVQVRSVTEGEDAQGEAEVRAEVDGHVYAGHGVSTDIVAACAQAFMDITNRVARRRADPPPPQARTTQVKQA